MGRRTLVARSTTAVSYTHLDVYKRQELVSGGSRVSYEAQVVLARPADVIEPGAREVPVAQLPDSVLNFIMPSRFCLPDELGHEAWQRFGTLAPGWTRVQTIVDFVHGALEFVPGASNPWTTAADAYRAGPVSYTHLDVYKRQGGGRVAAGLRARLVAEPPGESDRPDHGAVSYTHLDVYKRQV